MTVIDNYALGIDQGNNLLFSDFEDHGEMWTGQGERNKRVPVKFSVHYKSPPAVHLNIDMWDMDVKSNQRARIRAENITPDGFEIVFETWGDTRVARVSASWTAFGAVATRDTWEV